MLHVRLFRLQSSPFSSCVTDIGRSTFHDYVGSILIECDALVCLYVWRAVPLILCMSVVILKHAGTFLNVCTATHCECCMTPAPPTAAQATEDGVEDADNQALDVPSSAAVSLPPPFPTWTAPLRQPLAAPAAEFMVGYTQVR